MRCRRHVCFYASNRKLDYCNGDNRDAQYLASFPFVQLAGTHPGQHLIIMGVNHQRSGLASYFNIVSARDALSADL